MITSAISTVTHLDRFATGSIGWGGAVQCHRDPEKLNGKRIMYWKVGRNDGVREATLRVDDNMHCRDSVLYSSVFAVADDEPAHVSTKWRRFSTAKRV